MKNITEKAYAKINISLDVTGRRSDGYHEMLMVMQSVTLCDEVSIRLTEGVKSRAECSLHFVPGDERNLAVRAANRFFERVGIENTGAHIVLKKNIPVGAGMAGGSTDAAAVLRGLNKLTDAILRRASRACRRDRLGCCILHCRRHTACLRQRRGSVSPAAAARLQYCDMQARFFDIHARAFQKA